MIAAAAIAADDGSREVFEPRFMQRLYASAYHATTQCLRSFVRGDADGDADVRHPIITDGFHERRFGLVFDLSAFTEPPRHSGRRESRASNAKMPIFALAQHE